MESQQFVESPRDIQFVNVQLGGIKVNVPLYDDEELGIPLAGAELGDGAEDDGYETDKSVEEAAKQYATHVSRELNLDKLESTVNMKRL